MVVIHGYGVLNMVNLQQDIDSSTRILRSLVTNIENNIMRGEIDKKTMSVASRIAQLLSKIADALDALAKKVPESQEGAIELVSHAYLVRTPSGYVLIKTKPEHIALSFDRGGNTLSLKSRMGSMVVSLNSINISSRGLNINISSLTSDQLSRNRDELRILLKHFEKIVYNRLIPLIEQRIVRR